MCHWRSTSEPPKRHTRKHRSKTMVKKASRTLLRKPKLKPSSTTRTTLGIAGCGGSFHKRVWRLRAAERELVDGRNVIVRVASCCVCAAALFRLFISIALAISNLCTPKSLKTFANQFLSAYNSMSSLTKTPSSSNASSNTHLHFFHASWSSAHA